MTLSLGILLAWGAFAFGAVYPWAYWPLLVGSFTVGLAGWGASRPWHGDAPSRPLLGALAVAIAAISFQALPLPAVALTRVSPAGDAFFGTESVVSVRTALSLDALATALSLVWLLSLAVLFVGSVRWFGVAGTAASVRTIAVVGGTLALFGITQEPFYSGAVYGFWTPRFGTDPFGPFINENHFAGWMMMALPLVIGYFSAGVSRALRGVRSDWRSRLVWLSSPEANKLLLVATTALAMGLALVLTFSRSGITCLALALVLSGWFICRRQSERSRRSLRLAYVVLVAVVATGWAGVDAIAREFETSWNSMGGRMAAWKSGVRMAADFPLTGTGMNTYDTAEILYAYDATVRYVHAHNDYIQLAAEGGALVGLPLLVAAGFFVRDVRRRFRSGEDDETTYWIRAGAVTGLAAIALQEVVEFSLQMPGNMALFVVLCAIAVHDPGAGRTRHLGTSHERRLTV